MSRADRVAELLNQPSAQPVGQVIVSYLLNEVPADDRLTAAMMLALLGGSAAYEMDDRREALHQALHEAHDVLDGICKYLLDSTATVH